MTRVLVLSIPFSDEFNRTDAIIEITQLLHCPLGNVEWLSENGSVRLTFGVPVTIPTNFNKKLKSLVPGGIDVIKAN